MSCKWDSLMLHPNAGNYLQRKKLRMNHNAYCTVLLAVWCCPWARKSHIIGYQQLWYLSREFDSWVLPISWTRQGSSKSYLQALRSILTKPAGKDLFDLFSFMWSSLLNALYGLSGFSEYKEQGLPKYRDWGFWRSKVKLLDSILVPLVFTLSGALDKIKNSTQCFPSHLNHVVSGKCRVNHIRQKETLNPVFISWANCVMKRKSGEGRITCYSILWCFWCFLIITTLIWTDVNCIDWCDQANDPAVTFDFQLVFARWWDLSNYILCLMVCF